MENRIIPIFGDEKKREKMATEKSGKIEELGENNYRDWKLQMKSLLVVKDLWKVINGAVPQRPVRPAAAAAPAALAAYETNLAEFNEWIEANEKALAYIMMNISRINRNLISRATGGREAWGSLAAHHQEQDAGTRIRLQMKIGQTFISPHDSMRSHLNNIWEILDKIEDAGGAVDDPMRIATMVASVRPIYPSFASIVIGRNQGELTAVAVKASLIEEYESLLESRKVTQPSSKSDVGLEMREYRGSYGRQGWQRDQSKIKCNFCHQMGHMKKNCPIIFSSGVDLRDVINELKRKKENKANAADNGQEYTSCVFNSEQCGSSWVIDSGATCHMSPHKELFQELNNGHRSKVVVANGTVIEASGLGSVLLSSINNSRAPLKLTDTLWVPELQTNLISVSQLVKGGNEVKFKDKEVYMNEKKIADLVNNQYKVNMEAAFSVMNESNDKSTCAELCIHQWHRRMSHRNLHDIKHMKRFGLPVRKCDCSDDCESCFVGKMKKRPFGKGSEFEEALDCIVSDVCGPMQVESIGRKKYLLTFIDAYSKYCEVAFIREKSDVTEAAMHFIERMKNKLKKKPVIFRSDRGTEYMDQRFQQYLADEGIWFECTVGYCPEQNGMAEKKNDTLMNAARTMLEESSLPMNHWAEAVSLANHDLNRIISRGNTKSPFETMFGKKPKWSDFHQFGCEVYVKIPDVKRRKLDPKAVKMRFVGFDAKSKGYRVSNGSKVIVSREVHFPSENATKFGGTLDSDSEEEEEVSSRRTITARDTNSDRKDDNTEPQSDDDFQSAEELDASLEDNVEVQEEQVEPILRRSRRENKGVLPIKFQDYSSSFISTSDPRSYDEAIGAEDGVMWQEAMKSELDAIERNETWELVDLPKDRKAIGSKWVLKRKPDGNSFKYKARLVAQGFSQKYGVDYDEVFAPVARGTTMRILLSLAGKKNLIVKHYDVASAFLNGKLEEEIFMKPPKGIDTKGKVYRLKKSLYGLKQAANVWNKSLHESLTRNGCVQNKSDSCLYSYTSGGDIVHLLIHVDDILAATNNVETLSILMTNVGRDFEIKDLGNAKSYLGIELERDEKGHFSISQRAYINKIIEHSGMSGAKVSKFPLDVGYYKQQSEELPSNDEYRRLIGMLLYLTTNTRPDIAAAVGILSKKVMTPRANDMNEVKRVIRYLKGTENLKLKLSSDGCADSMVTYTDADWAEDTIDRKSNTGSICLMNGGAVSWLSRKQGLVSQSTAEAEYIALSETVKEGIFVQQIASDLGLEIPKEMLVRCDNKSAISLTENSKFSNRTKHIDTKYHFVRDMIEKRKLKVIYHPTETNIADMLTKPLGGIKIEQLRTLAGLLEIST